jgi:hypothetical protein
MFMAGYLVNKTGVHVHGSSFSKWIALPRSHISAVDIITLNISVRPLSSFSTPEHLVEVTKRVPERADQSDDEPPILAFVWIH